MTLILWGGVAAAQQTVDTVSVHANVREARAEAETAAASVRDLLPAAIPEIDGWTCAERDVGSGFIARALAAIPTARLSCIHADQELDVVLTLEPALARIFCEDFAAKRREAAVGRVDPDPFRFFETADWTIKRAAVDVTACARNVLAVNATGDRSEAAVARGPAAIDGFAQALSGTDPAPILEAYAASGHAAALDGLRAALMAQSRILAALVPAPPGFTHEVIQPAVPVPSVARTPGIVLTTEPTATVRLARDGCRLSVSLSAAPTELQQALVTRRWGDYRGPDGASPDLTAYVLRNTDRFVGRQGKDGGSLGVLVDGAVVVRIGPIGSDGCDEGTEAIVSQVFEAILAHDLRPFAPPAPPREPSRFDLLLRRP